MIDRKATIQMLELIGDETETHAVMEYSIPSAEGRSIIYPEPHVRLQLPYAAVQARLAEVLPGFNSASIPREGPKQEAVLDYRLLRRIGLHLCSLTAYGILNGGSATSYIDERRNQAYFPPLYQLLGNQFHSIADVCRGKPKALVPAYVNPDGSPGYSFFELKMRALLLLALEARTVTGIPVTIPIFEMRNPATDSVLEQACRLMPDSPLLSDLIEELSFDITRTEHAVQPLLAALTPKSAGLPRTVFTAAYGRENSLLALPGGHGQNFAVLKETYRSLHRRGRVLAALVNIDNLGNAPDPVHLALTLVTGAQASFEFARKTPVDVKGGVLVQHADTGRYACVDIGAAISPQAVAQAEAEGKEILFNCATGLFDLRWLTANLDEIARNLPVRISEQEKDAGRYAQAEQITWEVLEMVKDPLIIGVEKHRRFLAAKMLSEMLLTSRADELAGKLVAADPSYSDFCSLSMTMQQGLSDLLSGTYGLRIVGGRWEPLPAEELTAQMKALHSNSAG
jgi:UTP--glucose-1-phosphate uridylyltransferase